MNQSSTDREIWTDAEDGTEGSGRPLMYRPGPPLSRFIFAFWLQEGHALSHAEERLLPTGTTEVVFDLTDRGMLIRRAGATARFERYRKAVVCGPHSGYFTIDAAEPAHVLGIHFRAGGTYPFFGPPAHQLRNAVVPLESVLGTEADLLRERLRQAETPPAAFELLERVLMGLAVRNFERRPAVAYALQRFRDVPRVPSMAAVAEEVGVSQRRFIQVFREEVGLTPKVYCRIRRFQDVLGRIEQAQRIKWTDVAYACGYYDQAHFIHDFREFSGLNPTAYLERRGDRLNHVPIRAT